VSTRVIISCLCTLCKSLLEKQFVRRSCWGLVSVILQTDRESERSELIISGPMEFSCRQILGAEVPVNDNETDMAGTRYLSATCYSVTWVINRNLVPLAVIARTSFQCRRAPFRKNYSICFWNVIPRYRSTVLPGGLAASYNTHQWDSVKLCFPYPYDGEVFHRKLPYHQSWLSLAPLSNSLPFC